MRTLTIFFVFISLHSFAQTNVDFGKVKGDKRFCSWDNKQVDDNITYNLPRICNSTKVLEIRLSVATMPIPSFQLITLSYDTVSGWQFFKYIDNLTDTWYDTTIQRKVTRFDLQPNISFERLFTDLTTNKIFTLPDQRKLKLNDFVLDGIGYSITFKVNNKFRRYHFSNPEILIERNKNVEELQNYINIITLLWNGAND
jgi:hypothetical protein